MAKNIEPQLKLISEYLRLNSSAQFVIPEYQRGYSWSITNCDKLWQDIEAFIVTDGSDPYFFGTIIVNCSEENIFSLIDGQQRTTTFILLLKALLIRLNAALEKVPEDEETENLRAGLKSRRNDIISLLYKVEDEEIPSILKDFSKVRDTVVIENNSINELYKDEVGRILDSESFDEAEKNVNKIPRKQKDNKYTNQFRNFKFFYTQLGEKTESQLNLFAKVFLKKCQIIEIRSWQIEQAITMFNSLNSTGLPLSDADIISARLYSNSGDNKNEFNEKWEYINKLASELNAEKIVDIDAILMQLMYINRARKKEYINNGSVNVTVPGLRRYYIDIDKELLKDPLVVCRELSKIANIWNKIKDYTIVKLLLKFNENAKLYLVGYLYRFDLDEISEETVVQISESLIRLFTILELVDAGYSSKNFKTFLFGVHTKLVDNNVSMGEITKSFSNHIRDNWSESDIVERLMDYEMNILVFLNDYLYAKAKGSEFDFEDNVNVEHVMPSSGRNLDAIREDAGFSTLEEFKNHVNKLGNKILLEEDINKSIGNEWFKTKKQRSVKEKAGFKNSKYAIAAVLTDYPKDKWEKGDIEIATRKASERIAKFIFSDPDLQQMPSEEEQKQIEELRAKGLI